MSRPGHNLSTAQGVDFVKENPQPATRGWGCGLDDQSSTDAVLDPPDPCSHAKPRRTRRGVGEIGNIDTISGDVLDVSIGLHRELGPGLLETVYETVLAGKLAQRGYAVERQLPVDIEFDGMRFDAAFRIDLLVGGQVIVEVKSVERLSAVHAKQLLTYLRLTKHPLGLLINFGGAGGRN